MGFPQGRLNDFQTNGSPKTDIYNDSVPVEIEKRFKIPTKNKQKQRGKARKKGRKERQSSVVEAKVCRTIRILALKDDWFLQ